MRNSPPTPRVVFFLAKLMANILNIPFVHEETHRFADLIGIAKNLQRCVEMMRVARELFDGLGTPAVHNKVVTIEALWSAGVVSYTRCFRGGYRYPLCEKTVPEGLQEFHQRIFHIRNKHVAHSVNDMETNTPTVSIREEEGVRIEIDSIGEVSGWVLFRSDDMIQLAELSKAVLEAVIELKKKEKGRLIGLAHELGLGYFQALDVVSLEPGSGDPSKRRKH